MSLDDSPYIKLGDSSSGQPFKNDLHSNDANKDLEEASLPSDSDATSWKSLFSYTTRGHLAVLTTALGLTILSGMTKPAISIFLGLIFDEVTAFGSGSITTTELLKGVSTWCIALTSLGLAAWVINGGFFALWLVFGELQATEARGKLFIGMLEKEMEWYDRRKDGIPSLLTRVQTQIRELQIATSQPLGFFFEDAAATVAALGIAFFYSWKLTLVVLAIVPVLVLALSLITRRLQPAIEAQKRELTAASKLAHTAIAQVDTVKIFNGQDQEVQQYAAAIKTAAKSYLIQASSNALQMGLTRFVTVAMFVAGFWYGLVLVRQGLSGGSVLTTFYACMMATQSAEALLPQFLVLAKGMSAGETLRHIKHLIERGRKVTRMVGSRKPEICNGDVELSNVTFAYPSSPDQAVLHNTNFFFPAGETTFVIGKSGSGKSTLSNLILKYYKPSDGNIFIDGEAIQTLDVEWLRNNVFLLQQQSTLFNETMFRNIAFGRRKHAMVHKDDVRLACQTALLQDTIHNLPDGLDTMLGSGGNAMSGGQRQRIAIARSRLRDAPILILDEATSALDNISKTMIMEAIREWRKGKTTIIITHDISQIFDDDYVYVLEQGEIVEEGYRNRLEADPFGYFAAFLPISYKSEYGGELTGLPKRKISEDTLTSLVEPLENFEDDVVRTKRLSRVTRISKFLGVSDEPAPRSYLQGRRASLGFGTAQINDFISETVWKSPNVPQGVPLKMKNIMKPLPQLPDDTFTPPPGFDPTEPLSLLQKTGQATRHNRSNTVALDRSRRPTPELTQSGKDTKSNQSERILAKETITHTPSKAVKAPHASLKKILGTVWPVLKARDRLTLLLAFSCAFINAASTPAFSYVFAQLLNTFYLPTDQSEQARKWAIITLAIAIIDATSSYFFHFFLEYCGQVWIDTLRVEALSRILAQPRSWHDKAKNAPEKLDECLDRNAEEMRNLVGRFAGYVFVAASMMSIAIIWAFIVCWKLTLVGVASAPIMYALTRAYETVNARWEKKSDVEAEHVSKVFTETFSNIRVVRALILEDYFKSKQTAATMKAYYTGLRRAGYSGFFFGLSDSTNFFVTALILYYGAVIVSSGEWAVGSLLGVITLLLFSSANANAMLAFIPQINNSRTTATHMLYLANLPKRASHEAQGAKHLITPFPIRLNALSFSYPSKPDTQILHQVSMTFPAGSCTAIVGSSGSGKSTIASLLLGLYPPDTTIGTSTPPLTYAHTPHQHIHTPTLRHLLTLVSQTPVLFPTTIASNIAYGLPLSSPLRHPSAIEAAARQAGIHDFIASLPRGYNTVVGDGGQGLSGGQAQRISIARALVRRPRVLVLDEATSALDGESAAIIRETITGLMRRERSKRGAGEGGLRQNPYGYAHTGAGTSSTSAGAGDGMAVIIITHGIEMMRIAERIIMLDHGRVVEEGRFDDLMRAKGPFAKLVKAGEWD